MLKSTLWLLLASVALTACSSAQKTTTSSRYSVTRLDTVIGGEKVLSLNQVIDTTSNHLQIESVVILPGRGMNIYQIRAFIPGKGVVDLLQSPPLEESQKNMNGGPEDFNGNQSFFVGGSILIPYANRIRGTYLFDENVISTQILDHTIKLPANWKGKRLGAEPHAMHGLILKSQVEIESSSATDAGAESHGVLHAGDFGGHWLSSTDLDFTVWMHDNHFVLDIKARNAGTEPLPIGIGWHPFFKIPSGKRQQARLVIPAHSRTQTNNYDDVFPTGKVLPQTGALAPLQKTPGMTLKSTYLDDGFVDLIRAPQGAEATLVDPLSRYEVTVNAVSPTIKAIQVYAPDDKAFVAIEPQFNWGDPYGKVWKDSGKDTGMTVLKPGETTEYKVELTFQTL